MSLLSYLRQKTMTAQDFQARCLLLEHIAPPPYTPVNDKAAQFHASTAQINLLPGGNQSGKTTTVAHDHVQYARALPPGRQGLALTNTYKDIGKQLWPHYRECLHPAEYVPVWQNSAMEIPQMVRLLSNGYKFFFGSYDQGRHAHQGTIWDYVHFDEEAPHEIWLEAFRGALAHRARIGYSYTPIIGYGYLEELIDKGHDPAYPQFWSPAEPMSVDENPHIDEEVKATWASMLSEEAKRVRLHGYMADPEGLVYKEFDRNKHVINSFPIPNDWAFFRGLDFGKEHPTVSLIAVSDGYMLYVISEYYQKQRLVEHHIDRMWTQYTTLPLQVPSLRPRIITVADHDAQLRLEYENPRFGEKRIFSTPAAKERIAGIEVVQSLLAQDRIRVFSSCSNLIKEFGKYRYPGEDGRGHLKPGEKADDPIKEYDDCLDALRYICVRKFGYLSQQIYDVVSIR